MLRLIDRPQRDCKEANHRHRLGDQPPLGPTIRGFTRARPLRPPREVPRTRLEVGVGVLGSSGGRRRDALAQLLPRVRVDEACPQRDAAADHGLQRGGFAQDEDAECHDGKLQGGYR